MARSNRKATRVRSPSTTRRAATSSKKPRVRTSNRSAATLNLPQLPASYVDQVKNYFGGLAITAWHNNLQKAEAAMIAGATSMIPVRAPRPSSSKRAGTEAATAIPPPAAATSTSTRRRTSGRKRSGINQSTLNRVYNSIPEGGMIDRDNLKIPGRMNAATKLGALEQLRQEGKITFAGAFVQRAQELQKTG